MRAIETTRRDAADYSLLRDILNRLHIDPMLLTGIFLVLIYGTFVLYSASGADPDILVRQAARVGAAIRVVFVGVIAFLVGCDFAVTATTRHTNPFHTDSCQAIGTQSTFRIRSTGRVALGVQAGWTCNQINQ